MTAAGRAEPRGFSPRGAERTNVWWAPKTEPTKRPAFTLVELLVVVAVIALLVGILIPSLHGARAQARKVVCQSRLKQIGDALWSYSVENRDRVPFVVSPMTNGGAIGPDGPIPGFGDDTSPDELIDPFDRQRWPMSLVNTLTPSQLGDSKEIFVCPAANIGYPRGERVFTQTYRPAAANQLSGKVIEVPDGQIDYIKEHFGFLDGRKLDWFKPDFVHQPQTYTDYIRNVQQEAFLQAVHLRDMVIERHGVLIGPHHGGINVVNRRFHIEFRDHDTIQKQLQANGVAVQF